MLFRSDVGAVRHVGEAAEDGELAVQRKQQRQAAGGARIDGFLLARPVPAAAQPVVMAAERAQGFGRRVVQEEAQRLLAPAFPTAATAVTQATLAGPKAPTGAATAAVMEGAMAAAAGAAATERPGRGREMLSFS